MWHLLMAHQQESFLPFSSWQSLSCCLSHVAKGSTPKPRGPNFCPSHVIPTYSAKAVWSSLVWLPHLGFKSPRQSSSAAPFPTPPTVGYTGLHSYILPALLGCHSKSRQAWPHGMEPIISTLSRRPCTRGSYFPVPSWVEFTPISLAQSMATAI